MRSPPKVLSPPFTLFTLPPPRFPLITILLLSVSLSVFVWFVHSLLSVVHQEGVFLSKRKKKNLKFWDSGICSEGLGTSETFRFEKGEHEPSQSENQLVQGLLSNSTTESFPRPPESTLRLEAQKLGAEDPSLHRAEPGASVLGPSCSMASPVRLSGGLWDAGLGCRPPRQMLRGLGSGRVS